MKIYSTSLILVLLIKKCITTKKMEGKIQGGEYTDITKFPHAVYLTLNCKGHFICGGSILNQYLVLTAAHCVEDCPKYQANIVAYYGHHNIGSGTPVRGQTAIFHEYYDDTSLVNDIGMISLKSAIRMGQAAKRVVIVGYGFPNSKKAWVAGWGVQYENGNPSNYLKATYQEIPSMNTCYEALRRIPDGAFCAGPRQYNKNYSQEGAALEGDSGSALIVNGHIQIGIVSYKLNSFNYVVYTNVTYHFNWIKKTAQSLVCN